MQIVEKDQANKISPLPSTTIFEYLMDEDTISGAFAEINGRYPDLGYAMNETSKELVYIVSGSGKIVKEAEEKSFGQGDTILIENNEKYYWEGNFSMFMANVPKFSAGQHKIVPQ